MSKIFISYRREDSQDASGRIFDRLTADLGRDHVFMDVDNIPPGVDFREHLKNSVQQCNVQLAIIGRRWLNSVDESGRRRIDNKDDFVRIEIELALKQKQTLVIPVLLHGVNMPRTDELPRSLRQLTYRNAVHVRHNNFQRDLDQLVTTLKSGKGNQSPQSAKSVERATPAIVGPPPLKLPKSKRPANPPKLRMTQSDDWALVVDPARPATSRNKKSDSWQLYAAVVAAVLTTFVVVGIASSWIGNMLDSPNSVHSHEVVPLPE